MLAATCLAAGTGQAVAEHAPAAVRNATAHRIATAGTGCPGTGCLGLRRLICNAHRSSCHRSRSLTNAENAIDARNNSIATADERQHSAGRSRSQPPARRERPVPERLPIRKVPVPAQPVCDRGFSNDPRIAYTPMPRSLLQCNSVPSLGFEATGTAEFGDGVGLRPGGGRTLSSLRVLFNSFGCSDSGHWFSGDCVTTPGATFTHPITANIYAVGSGGAPGPRLATVTQNATIPFRPSADPVRCTGANAGKFFNTANGQCVNSMPVLLTFNLPPTLLPDQVIWTVAFNTTHFGNPPIGENTECFHSAPGCGYDSLNVGAFTFPGAPYVGTDLDPRGAYLNSAIRASYCDGGAGGTGTLRLDTSASDCWEGFTPLGEVRVT